MIAQPWIAPHISSAPKLPGFPHTAIAMELTSEQFEVLINATKNRHPHEQRSSFMKTATESKVNLVGWILFVISALSFIVASLRVGDTVYLLGSVFFLLGCVAFLTPYVARMRGSRPD